MRLLPKNRWLRVAAAVAVVTATLALAYWVEDYRPWEAHYKGKPSSWWAGMLAVHTRTRFPPPPPPPSRWTDRLRGPFDDVLKLSGYRKREQREAELPYLVCDDVSLEVDELFVDPAMVPVLVELLEYPDSEMQLFAADALSLRRRGHRHLVAPALARMLLTDQDPYTRACAAAGLQTVAPEATEAAAAALRKCLGTEKDAVVRDTALTTLRKIDPDAAREWEETGGRLERP